MKPWEYPPTPLKRRAEKASAEVLNSLQEAELLHRHRLGYIEKRACRRLEKLFSDPPPDMTARLLKACEHLGVTGEYAELYEQAGDHAEALERLWGRVDAGVWPIGNANVLEAYLKRARGGDAEALRPVLAYVLQERVMEELEEQP
jgi:hypothetical protein